jgi:hypothetical protein
MTTTYAQFLAAKRWTAPESGIELDARQLHPSLFGFQRELVRWAIRRGRAAVFADTGLGKTRIQLEWARTVADATGGRVLVLAPLAVAQQTSAEAAALGMDVPYVRDQAGVATAVAVTNYDRLHLFDPAQFTGVVLDESSILKSFSGTIKRALVAAFRATPYRLACTATPAPNDLEELCNHADFLGVMSPAEMRSTFFIADSRGEFMRYRLKGHARDAFFSWMATWSAAVRTPSDLGYPDDGYRLPGLAIEPHFVATDWTADGQLFALDLSGITERAQVRKATVGDRVTRAVDLVTAEPGEPWLVWCGLNGESAAVTAGVRAALPGARVVEVTGSDTTEQKAAALLGFARGELDVLVTKPTLAGFGMNFQRCARMVFVGLSDSYEQYYQAIRRCYRYGQTRPVAAHIVLSEPERVIFANVRRKEQQAARLSGGLVAGAIAAQADVFAGTSKGDSYEPSRPLTIPHWLTTEEAA